MDTPEMKQQGISIAYTRDEVELFIDGLNTDVRPIALAVHSMSYNLGAKDSHRNIVVDLVDRINDMESLEEMLIEEINRRESVESAMRKAAKIPGRITKEQVLWWAVQLGGAG